MRVSSPSAARAAAAARCGPAARAVATRTCCAVGGEVGVVGGHRRPGEVPERRGPVGSDQDPGGVQPPMGDPEGVEPPGVAPDALQELVVDLLGIQPVQGTAAGLGHQQPVALRGHPGRHHREHPDPGPLGQQGDEGLMLDLGPAAQRQVGRVAPVPQRRPGGGQQLAVPGVPAIDLDQQRAPARPLGGDDRSTAGRQRRLVEPRSVDTQLGQGVGDLGEGEAARRRAEQQMDDGRRPDPDGEGRDHPDGEGGPQRHPGRPPRARPPVARRTGTAGPGTGRP